ncbi:MAG: hypothetical protein HN356_09735 [Calditrichaeota bacterium]|nr:hypothetical protein [Calditrichota bacterium]MBT7789625.1 hypothetical protein [Calditrichota bacterium]
MQKLTNTLLLALLITAFVFVGCSKVDNPSAAYTTDSDPDLNLINGFPDGDEKDRTPIPSVEDLYGTWILEEVYSNKMQDEVPDVIFTFNDDGSGQISKAGEAQEMNWALNEKFLEITFEDKVMKMAAFVEESDLYLAWLCFDGMKEFDDKKKEFGDKKEDFGDKKEDMGDKEDHGDKKDFHGKKHDKKKKMFGLKMKLVRE